MAVSAYISAQSRLMPLPADLKQGDGVLTLRSTFKVQTPASHDERLEVAIARAVRRIETAADLKHEGTGNVAETPLEVKVTSPGQAVQSVTEDESYSLTVTGNGVAIDAATDVGAMHALETLVQLVQPTPNGYVVPAVTVHDAPRFPWRGLLIDCGRHFEPVAVIKRTLDGMAAVKMNVFHWHLTEDQGYRLESKVFPKLTGMGSDGLFYTQAEVKDVIAYARARGIRVVPEIEMPGHSMAWLYAYPQLDSGTKADGIRREFGVSNTAIDPTREETYVFIRKLLTEVAALFPDEYIHIGGDETPAPDWKTNPRILAFKKTHHLEDNEELQAYFNTRVLSILTSLHKRMMGWDEILTPKLPKDIVVQSWRGTASLAKGASMGYTGILSAPYYLDHMGSTADVYLADPIPANSTMTAEEKKRVLGGEVTMWGEHVDQYDIDSRIWPRTAAVAERFWSPQSVTDVNSMYARLLPTSLELESLRLTHISGADVRLRALAHSEDIADLQTIASTMEPVSFSERYRGQKTNQLTALDRFIEAVRPDPPTLHWHEQLAGRCIQHDDAACAQLHTWYQSVDAAIPHAREQMQGSPQMRDVLPRLDQLHSMMQLGEEATVALSKNKTLKANTDVLDQAKKPVGLVRFGILKSLATMVTAASEK